MNKLILLRKLLPLFIFVLLVAVLWRGLYLRPNQIPSPLINKPIPEFALPTLAYPDKLITQRDFIGHITLLNVFASWCYACAEEHAFLLEVAKKEYVTLYGLDYKDNPADAKQWLQQHGNPYQMIGVDPTGKAALDWGVYGTPETFLIDQKGMIRYKQIGPLTQDVWEHTLQPMIAELRKEQA